MSKNNKRKNKKIDSKKRAPSDIKKNGVGRDKDNKIVVKDDKLEKLIENINWNNLTPLEKYLIKRIELLEDKLE